MRGISIATAVVALSAVKFIQIAAAADMPVKAPVVVPIGAPAWTGWYLGLNAGGNWARSETSTAVANSLAPPSNFNTITVSSINVIGDSNIDTSGFIGGVQGGYNYQAGQWLFGFEADFEYFRSSGANSVTGTIPGFVGFSLLLNSSLSTDWLVTVRPRLGAVLNNWLIYATGGLAVTELRANWNLVLNPTAGFTESASAAVTKAGWTVGGGFETMLPGKYTIGVEYLYVRFDNVSSPTSFAASGTIPISNPFNHSVDLTSNIVRLRLNKSY